MKKLFNAIMLSTVVLLTACHTQKTVSTSQTYGVSVTRVVMSRPDTLCNAQMDSVVRVDKLPQIAKWATSAFKDDESGNNYTYKILYDKTTKTTYTVKVLSSDKYVLSKKVLETR